MTTRGGQGGVYSLGKRDQCGYLLPKIPAGGCFQILGSMSTDKKTIPPYPEWLAQKFWSDWPRLWRSRQIQYKSPGSKEILPWDTTHSLLGDYNGYEPGYYVKGCFGYDKRGTELMMKPRIPDVHEWIGGRWVVCVPVYMAEIEPPQTPTPFKFYDKHVQLNDVRSNALQLTNGKVVPYMLDNQIELPDLHSVLGSTPGRIIGSLKDLSINSASVSTSFETGSTSTDVAASDNTSDDLSMTSSVFDTVARNKAVTITNSPIQKNYFLSLPGELRNRIYGYIWPNPETYEIMYCTRGKDLTHYRHKIAIADKGHKFGWRRLDRRCIKLDVHFERPVKNTKATTKRRRDSRLIYGSHREERSTEFQAAGPAALLQACRQTYAETMALFYNMHIFSISSRSVLRMFMNCLSQGAMAQVTRLYIAHDPQGYSLDVQAQALIEKERKAWIQDMKSMVSGFSNLEYLTLFVRIREPYINAGDQADWAVALRQGLAKLANSQKFVHLDLTIRLGDETSDAAKIGASADPVIKKRCQDLNDLVWKVKEDIFGTQVLDG